MARADDEELHVQLAISDVSIGAAFGALVGGLAADRFGRRLALMLSDLLFAAGGAHLSITIVDKISRVLLIVLLGHHST